MTLATLKSTVAAYLQKTAADLEVNSVDLFLVAVNNARRNAELRHNFEFCRTQATLDIDGETGAAISDATFGTEDTLTVTGTLSSAITGTYTRQGSFGGYPLYIREAAAASFVYYNATNATYTLNVTLTTGALSTGTWLPATDQLVPAGTYAPQAPSTGTATIVLATESAFSGIKEIVAIMRTNEDGTLVPLDFARSDIPIERDRTAAELDDEYWPLNRYPSDAALLARGENTSIVQRGQRLAVYPLDTTSSTPMSTTLEVFAWLKDYTTADLATDNPDFFVQYGSEFLLWSAVCELNYRFAAFVPRQEGVLSPPEQNKERAWRDLLLWDSYQVDSNSTRSR